MKDILNYAMIYVKFHRINSIFPDQPRHRRKALFIVKFYHLNFLNHYDIAAGTIECFQMKEKLLLVV